MILSKGEKQYLKGQGISEGQFDKMDKQSKKEWVQECHEKTYEKNWSKKLATNSKTFSFPNNNLKK